MFWKRINWKREYRRLDEETIELCRQLDILKMRESICRAVYQCEDVQKLKMMMKAISASSGTYSADGMLNAIKERKDRANGRL